MRLPGVETAEVAPATAPPSASKSTGAAKTASTSAKAITAKAASTKQKMCIRDRSKNALPPVSELSVAITSCVAKLAFMLLDVYKRQEYRLRSSLSLRQCL